MNHSIRNAIGALLLNIAMISGIAHAASPQTLAFERTEQRAPCNNYQPHKQALFGDLHVHTSYSFDSYISGQRNDPWDAYGYAKGEAIYLSNEQGEQTLKAQIQRPLDFTGITDHGEFLGQISVCTSDPGRLGYWWPHCMMTRSNLFYVQLLAASWWVNLGVSDESADKGKSFACTLSDCSEGDREFWNNIQQAAEDHYDRSEECSFTTFVGYEYTDAPDFKNMHRNVIFRNDQVTDLPITTYDTGTYNFPDLWVALREQCIDGGKGCDVMSIPHNPNLAGGMMFPDPKNEVERDNRLFFEPVVELIQHKAASECRYDRLVGNGSNTVDELCDFEQVKTDNLTMLGSLNGEIRTERAVAVSLEDFHERNMLRNVLKVGIATEQAGQANPFKMGFIGSTDTHSATPGGTEENNYVGHLGRRDAGYRNVQDHFFANPGGHAVVWAEENSRDSIFAAIRRKETYATSGTRPIVRFFAGWDYSADLCQSSNLVAQGYAGGVPMGGDMTRPPAADATPSFLVTAMKDNGSSVYPGTDLQRVQMIKGWVDSAGKTHEQVFDIAGSPNNGASVDPDSCALIGEGHSNLCVVWQDPNFDAASNAFYYARVLENPSCRWSTLQCQAAGVNPFAENCEQLAAAKNQEMQDGGASGNVYGKCCLNKEEEPFYSPTIQERAWTSPVWYKP